MRILQGLRARYEEYHQVTYTDDALEAATRLARRHLRDLRLPDSAIDVLDEAGAGLRLNLAEDGQRVVGVPEVERVVARMARIPESQASSSDRERLRTLARGAEARGLRPGRSGGHGGLARSSARARASARPERPAGSLPLHRPHRCRARRSSRSSSPGTSATSSIATT